MFAGEYDIFTKKISLKKNNKIKQVKLDRDLANTMEWLMLLETIGNYKEVEIKAKDIIQEFEGSI